ncbi:MAG: glycosyltransferase family A protein [Planctomycetota bacterium]|nr:glycosyltransferase family A protein [Planctomycetota bacterium]
MTDLADRIGEELAFGAAAGAMLVVGEAPRSIVMGAAASATVVALVGDHEAVAADLEALLPPPIVVVDDAASIPDGCYGAAVVWEPPGDATSTLERVLAVVADAGAVHAVLRPPDRGVGGRWRRLIEASCEAGAFAEELEDGRLVVKGARRAPSPDDRTLDVGPLPFTAVVHAAAGRVGLERTLVDVLLRPGYPPEEVFVVDGVGDAPDDLWGFAAAGASRTVLVNAAGQSFTEAVNDALGGVASELVALIGAGERLAANHVSGLAMLLGSSGDAGAAVAESALTPGAPAGPLFRTDVLRALEGLDPGAGDPIFDLWCRLSADHGVAVHPAPLARPVVG